jgi:hypothetical protein
MCLWFQVKIFIVYEQKAVLYYTEQNISLKHLWQLGKLYISAEKELSLRKLSELMTLTTQIIHSSTKSDTLFTATEIHDKFKQNQSDK